MRLYVGNLPEEISETELRYRFEAFGRVTQVEIVRDRAGKSRGFGYVTMPVEAEAHAARIALNGVLWGDRCLQVEIALPFGFERPNGEPITPS
jgi:RNA recognition motif-containing protein